MQLAASALMFYGGMAGAGIFLLAAIAVFFFGRRRRKRLHARLEEEYGERSG